MQIGGKGSENMVLKKKSRKTLFLAFLLAHLEQSK
jgi:hypothetical protein